MKQPQTLQDAIKFYSDPDNCLNHLVSRRWPNGVECPTCGRKDVRFIKTRRIWECKSDHAKKQFSVKIGTIFEDSPIGLDKWLTAFWMLANCRNGISSYEIARDLGITQKSAWFMLHRIRLAMQNGSLLKMGGSGTEIEVDESFIGGKARNMHKNVYQRKYKVPGSRGNKVIAFGILDRDNNQVRTAVIENRLEKTVRPLISENVHAGSAIFTDDMGGYQKLGDEFAHKVVDHAVKYVDGRVHTNGLENFWSLLKRGLHGTYISVEPFHLFRYLDEQSFRFNNRKVDDVKLTDLERFNLALNGATGKRVTYQQLIGKAEEA